jgi:hypothetical protein
VPESQSKTKVCHATRGCGRDLPLTAFPDTAKRPHGSLICSTCLLSRIRAYEVDKSAREISRAKAEQHAALRRVRQELAQANAALRRSTKPAAVPTRTCNPRTGCGTTKPVQQFPDTPNRPNGSRICFECQVRRAVEYEAKKQLREANELIRTFQTAYPGRSTPSAHQRAYDSHAAWGYRLKAARGVTPADYSVLLTAQSHQCAVCAATEDELRGRRTRRFHPDGTEEYQGPPLVVDSGTGTTTSLALVCVDCHLMLERLRHEPSLLSAAATYLETSSLAMPLGACTLGPDACNACALTRDWTVRAGEHLPRWNRSIRTKYAMSPATLFHVLAANGSTCAICHDPTRSDTSSGRIGAKADAITSATDLVIDREGTPARARGLLCRPCHLGLERARRSPQILRQGVQYLSRNS